MCGQAGDQESGWWSSGLNASRLKPQEVLLFPFESEGRKEAIISVGMLLGRKVSLLLGGGQPLGSV